jgi:hypothetical protein
VPTPEPSDPVLTALDELVRVLHENAALNDSAIRRADLIRRLRERGLRYSEIVPLEERPLIVELLTHNLYELSDASSRFRKAEARALYSDGLTMSEIAELFGVTRQRVAALLRSSMDQTNSDAGAVRRPRRRTIPRNFIAVGLTKTFNEHLTLVERVLDWNTPL